MILEVNSSTAHVASSACQKITLEGIWNDFYEQIRKFAGNGIIVKVEKGSGQEKYTIIDSEPNMQDKIWIMFAYEFAQCCIPSKQPTAQVDPNIAGELMHGVLSDSKKGSGNALRKILERFSGGINLTALEQERDYIEKIIKKTFAAKLYRNSKQINSYCLSQEDLGEITVSDEDYNVMCDKLFSVITEQYVQIFAEDERYSWLFKGRTSEDSRQITRYLVALLCVALMGIDTYYKSAGIVRKIDESKATIKENILTFLASTDTQDTREPALAQSDNARVKKVVTKPVPASVGLTPEEYEDRKVLQQAVFRIKKDFPSIDAKALFDELVTDFLEIVKATFYDVWEQYDRNQKAHEIIEAYYDQKSAELSESITRT